MHNQERPDSGLIKRHTKTRRKEDGGMTFRRCLDQVGRELYCLRHFHEASAKPAAALTPQYYLRTVQKYYLDF